MEADGGEGEAWKTIFLQRGPSDRFHGRQGGLFYLFLLVLQGVGFPFFPRGLSKWRLLLPILGQAHPFWGSKELDRRDVGPLLGNPDLG